MPTYPQELTQDDMLILTLPDREEVKALWNMIHSANFLITRWERPSSRPSMADRLSSIRQDLFVILNNVDQLHFGDEDDL